jgi:hypothetical protein
MSQELGREHGGKILSGALEQALSERLRST